MRFVRTLLLPFIFAALTSRAAAENTISWSSGYPKAGCCSGSMLIKGTITLDCGWSVKDVCRVKWWVDGLEAETSEYMPCGSTFGEEEIASLISCTTYNVIVEVIVTNGCSEELLITAAAKVTIP